MLENNSANQLLNTIIKSAEQGRIFAHVGVGIYDKRRATSRIL